MCGKKKLLIALLFAVLGMVPKFCYLRPPVDFFVLQEFPILCQTCLGDNPYIRMVMC